MTIRISIAVTIFALYAACSMWEPWGDAWCECVYAQDSTYFAWQSQGLATMEE